ncbi:MAG: type I methionyl aminopeptidase [Candidatus Colwellbacteria bacterium CG10_big_fil_rev_8_21_14_0_10_42_22]|uniref:Methionine aminopeptidase n=1 Tax=Candidatus Colwellbacteria bacterium CG10_big_fil_rev_8_21_14_0_10_42_22 TaxID=1974540 RepID=A0A2H0VFF6_9BACT|nr:MAG: type I methionyl aminopeptidase [Candidatus Colwellbacteria bacterium CG10_big_fil_rev_8_21_14_0_10_42_22]
MALIKTPEQIKNIRQSARILANTLRRLKEYADVGTNLLELEDLARELIEDAGGKPAFLGYHPDGAEKPYPYALCTSVNEIIVHGQPHSYQLKEGDILSLDLGVNWRGGISDAAITIPIGKINTQQEKLIEDTEESLKAGIRMAKAGNTLGDIGYAIESVIKKGGWFVVDGLTGHGVGEKLHEEPAVLNYGNPGEGTTLRSGMVLALEPMVSMGTERIKMLDDDSFATFDGSMSAHFEHTILITKNRAEILTL